MLIRWHLSLNQLRQEKNVALMSVVKSSNDSASWTVENLIDFDFAIDAEDKAANLDHKTHREIYRRFAEANPTQATTHDSPKARQATFLHWLQERQTLPPLAQLRPGLVFLRALRIVQTFLVASGVAAGALLSLGLLRYDGTQPTNVAGFLCLLLGGQIFLLLLSLATFLLRRFGVLHWENSVVGPGIQFGLLKTVAWVQRKTTEQTPAKIRLQIQAFFGTVGRRQHQYQAIIIGQLTRLIQTFGIWFNVSALATTLLLVAVSDRAFGWQTSLTLSPHQVHSLTDTISLPWSWIHPRSTPSLEAIEGSRIFLKDGIKTLENRDLVAWWPFLVFSLFTYGFVPRLALWLASHWYIKHRLASLRFDSLPCDQLWDTMVNKELRTAGDAPKPRSSFPEHRPASPKPEKENPDVAKPDHSSIIIVEPELAKRLDRSKTDQAIYEHIGWEPKQWIRLPDETQSSQDFWTLVEPQQTSSGFERIACLQEIIQPPIRETIDLIKELRSRQSSSGKLLVFTIGKLPETGKRREICQSNQQVWKQSLETLKDPNVNLAHLDAVDA